MAWIEARPLRSGKTRYRVYWRDPAGNTHGKVFARKRDADEWASGRPGTLLVRTEEADGLTEEQTELLLAWVEGA